jgi:hypothetical protein
MGRTLLILLVGFTVSFGLLAASKSRRFLSSVDRVVEQFTSYSAKNAATSGAYMALNRLFQSNTWRTGYSNLVIAGDSVSVIVDDQTTDSTLAAKRIRVRAIGHNKDTSQMSQALLFDGNFYQYAIWAKDTVTNVIAKDASNIADSSYLMFNAPFMPNIDHAQLLSTATSQSQVQSASPWIPNDTYPNSSFYYLGSTPNVTHVQGDMLVMQDRIVYGIFVVEGDVTIQGNGLVRGILYLPNTTSTLTGSGGDPSEDAKVRGGVVIWGDIDGQNRPVAVRFESTYINAFQSNFAKNNGPLRVLTWQ